MSNITEIKIGGLYKSKYHGRTIYNCSHKLTLETDDIICILEIENFLSNYSGFVLVHILHLNMIGFILIRVDDFKRMFEELT